MYFEVEGSGCAERKGYVQVRFSFYLEEKDYGYDVHHVQIPDYSTSTYKGEFDKEGMPIDFVDYKKWEDGLPKLWVNNPFHNHFVLIEPYMEEKEIVDMGDRLLDDAYSFWSSGYVPALISQKVPIISELTVDRVSECVIKVQQIKAANIVGEKK